MQTIDQRMTLRRFVRVTFDNFRQLLQTISAPAANLPMPPFVPPAPASAEPPFSAGSTPLRAPESAAALGGESLGDTQFGGEQVSDDALGDVQFGGDTVGDALGGESPADNAPVADALGSDLPDDTPSPAHPFTPSPPHPLPLPAALESLLFVSDEAVEPLRLAQALGIAPAEAEAALLALDAAYREERRGLRLQVRNGRFQLVTAPEAADLIETYLNLDASARLSAPALETLAVVAYRQPVTRSQIEAVRGVDCSGVLRSLIGRGLLEEVGRLDAPGRPVLYGVTDLFMHHFGLTALHELPPLEDAELAAIEEVGA